MTDAGCASSCSAAGEPCIGNNCPLSPAAYQRHTPDNYQASVGYSPARIGQLHRTATPPQSTAWQLLGQSEKCTLHGYMQLMECTIVW